MTTNLYLAEIEITYKKYVFFKHTHTTFRLVTGKNSEEAGKKVNTWAKLYHPDQKVNWCLRQELC